MNFSARPPELSNLPTKICKILSADLRKRKHPEECKNNGRKATPYNSVLSALFSKQFITSFISVVHKAKPTVDSPRR
jgi:hypothetical protein